MNDTAPVVYLLYGDDLYEKKKVIDALLGKMGDPSTAEMNTSRLAGSELTLDALRTAASSVPFLAERRLVIAENASHRFNDKDKRDKFKAIMEGLHPATALVLLEASDLKVELPNKKVVDHWLLKWAKGAGERVYLHGASVPKGMELAKWVQEYAREQGGEIDFQAAQLLAEMAGDEPLMAATEVDKLLAYVNYTRTVDVEDVDGLSTFGGGRGDYFKFVDALAAGNGRAAMDMLQRLMDEQEPLQLFFSLVGQFRLLVQVREIYEDGGLAGTVEKQLGLHPYRAQKLYAQAKALSMGSLESIFHRLAEYDVQIKTGQIDADLALETLVAALTSQ